MCRHGCCWSDCGAPAELLQRHMLPLLLCLWSTGGRAAMLVQRRWLQPWQPLRLRQTLHLSVLVCLLRSSLHV